MAFSHGRSTVFKLDNAGGTLTDISVYCDSVQLPEATEVFDTTTFQATAKTFMLGFTEASLSVGGKWDPTLDAHLNGIKGQAATVSFEYGPEGSTTGKVRYTGEAVMLSYNRNSSVTEISTWQSEFRVSGAVTRATYP
jgi:hypothetical protein